MKKTLIGTIAAAFFVTISLSAAPPQQQVPLQPDAKPAGPSLSFSTQSVTASGFPPHSRVVFFGVALVPTSQSVTLRRWVQTVDDTDGDGSITLDLHQPVPPQSMWAAVDVNGNDVANAPGPGSAGTVIDATQGRFRRAAGHVVDTFGLPGSSLYLLYVHPGHGIWTWEERDGTPTDKDGSNNVTTVDVSHAVPLDPAYGKPSEFVAGGILVGVDWTTMRLLTVRLTGALLGGVQ